MKPAPFDYVRARSLEHALECLSTGDAKVIAGGQSLMPMMNFRLASPEVLVDIDGLTDLDRIVVRDDEVVLGALVRHDRLARDPSVRQHLPLLAEAAGHIGHVAIRNRGTLGGSLAHADPTAELPAVCAAVRARIVCDRADGRRREISAGDFFRGLYETALEADELITWVRVPQAPPGSSWGFSEIAPREGDFAWAGACCVIEPGADGAELRVTVFGVEPTARTFTTTLVAAADAMLVPSWVDDLRPTSDPDFRRDLAGEMIRRAIHSANERIGRDV